MPELVTAARPYARAALENARTHGTSDQWSQTLTGLAIVVSDPTARELIGSPRYSTRQISDVIIGILGNTLNEPMRNFVHLLTANRRLALAADIATLFERDRAKDQNICMIEIVSAYPLGDSEQAALCKAVEARTGHKAVATCRVDTNLLGGASVRVVDRDLVIDGSLKDKLEKLSQTLIH